MSVDFFPTQNVNFKDLFDGRLEVYGIQEAVTASTSPDWRYLADEGGNCISVIRGDHEFVSDIIVRSGNNSQAIYDIFNVIAHVFDTDFATLNTEYLDRFDYFKFKEQGNWDLKFKKMAAEKKKAAAERIDDPFLLLLE